MPIMLLILMCLTSRICVKFKPYSANNQMFMAKNSLNVSDALSGRFQLSLTELEKIDVLMNLPANEWLERAKKLPNPKPLFGNIWHEGEVAILFSNTGVGKSILGVQIADSISSGKSILNLETDKQGVIYFDFELSTKAFQRRYTDDLEQSYLFNEEFHRVEIDRTKELSSPMQTFEEIIIDSIKSLLKESKAKVIIIDNITFLSATNEKSKEALALMKLVLELSRKRNLAILLIAHTPKRDFVKPIQLEDLAGSKALSNFTDVCFCIGESVQGPQIRYIKQLKNRNYPIEYHDKNIIECRVVKVGAFLQFKHIGLGSEDQHLRKVIADDNLINEILMLREKGMSNVQIGAKLSISETSVRRRLKKHTQKKNDETE